MISLVDIKNSDSYTYRHSVNVGILALVLGISYDLNKNDLYDLVMGSILHDIGKMFIPSEILMKKGKLTPEEFRIIQEHPTRGFHYLKDYSNLSAKARIVVLQHQERIDGSGYPYGLKGDQIYIFSKIAAVADIYDALISDRIYRAGIKKELVSNYLLENAGKTLSIPVVQIFYNITSTIDLESIFELAEDAFEAGMYKRRKGNERNFNSYHISIGIVPNYADYFP